MTKTNHTTSRNLSLCRRYVTICALNSICTYSKIVARWVAVTISVKLILLFVFFFCVVRSDVFLLKWSRLFCCLGAIVQLFLEYLDFSISPMDCFWIAVVFEINSAWHWLC